MIQQNIFVGFFIIIYLFIWEYEQRSIFTLTKTLRGLGSFHFFFICQSPKILSISHLGSFFLTLNIGVGFSPLIYHVLRYDSNVNGGNFYFLKKVPFFLLVIARLHKKKIALSIS